MNDLEKARQSINSIDKEMAALFEKRMDVCETIAKYKMEHGLSVYDASREENVIQSNRKNVSNPNIERHYVQFLKNVMDISKNYQEEIMGQMKVAFSGVEGAFAHIASEKMFPGSNIIPYKSFTEAYKAVEKGEADVCVLPLENSYAGEVGAVMDLMFSGELFINQIIDMDIRHNLLAQKDATLSDIKTVVSHPQALEQCKSFIRSYGFEIKEFSNTAAAAEYVRDSKDKSIAAIASEETARIYDLEILKSDINDIGNNTTRFGAFSNAQNKPTHRGVKENENFILVFTVQNKAGALAQTLNIIGAHGYNMRALRSRPMKGLQWNYYFYIEAEGNINNENGQDMLRELSAICARLKLVGNFCLELDK